VQVPGCLMTCAERIRVERTRVIETPTCNAFEFSGGKVKWAFRSDSYSSYFQIPLESL
jgi:hypothetical protein